MDRRAWAVLLLPAATVLLLGAIRGGSAAVPPRDAVARLQQPAPVACTRDRDEETETIGPDGGEIDTKYARVVFPHGAYAAATEVTLTPEPAYHGITLSPPPAESVLVLLRVDYCGGPKKNRYWLETGSGQLSAVQMELGRLVRKKWAGAMVGPEAFRRSDSPGQALLQRSGFVILSN
jgi:hypothetical protein